MFKFLVSTVAITSSIATNVYSRASYEEKFFEHMQKFSLNFKDGAEFTQRLQIFADNYDIVEKHNSDPNQTYKLGMNKYAHMTLSEFHDYMHLGGTRPKQLRRASNKVHASPVDKASIPTSVDWSTAGAVTPVKDQGNCGSCWAFSTTGSLEGAYYLKYGTLLSFSEQELTSCDTVDGGCNGGFMDTAFEWIQSNGGLATEDAYPYTSGTSGSSGTCKSGVSDNAQAVPASYTDVAVGSVDALMSAVAQQPVSIAIQANQLAFQLYSTGVLTGKCGNNLDHGVLAVGYGTLNGVDYWKVKNSWSNTWGMNGYILIERSANDLCGVLDAASYPNM